MKKVLVLHGANLNSLGMREPEIYGSVTLATLNTSLVEHAKLNGAGLSCFQSNSEAELIAAIYQAATDKIDHIIINAGAFTHTSIALRDALVAVNIPFIELHISNIYARESFRHHSWLSGVAKGVICGLGIKGYLLALQHILDETHL